MLALALKELGQEGTAACEQAVVAVLDEEKRRDSMPMRFKAVNQGILGAPSFQIFP